MHALKFPFLALAVPTPISRDPILRKIVFFVPQEKLPDLKNCRAAPHDLGEVANLLALLLQLAHKALHAINHGNSILRTETN